MKKRSEKMWALWNFNRLMGTRWRRKEIREYANELIVGGKPAADKMFKAGSLSISKVIVREI